MDIKILLNSVFHGNSTYSVWKEPLFSLKQLPLPESFWDIHSHPTSRIIRVITDGLAKSYFDETQLLNCLDKESLAKVLSHQTNISEDGLDKTIFDMLVHDTFLNPPFCTACEKASGDRAKHCIWCGKKFSNIFCPNCKTRNAVEAIYCMECGQER